MSEEEVPDFSEFEDWRASGSGDGWSYPYEVGPLLTEHREVIARNVTLLLNSQSWHQKVEKFETLLNEIPDGLKREKLREKFAIRFDHHNFGNRNEPLDLSNYRFPCMVSFANTIFGRGGVNFAEAHFTNGVAWFINSIFGDGNVSFHGAKFGNGGADFSGANFQNGDIIFSNAIFDEGGVRFDRTHFGFGNTSFNHTRFGDAEVFFGDAFFGEGTVSFIKAQFGNGKVIFDRTSFGSGDVVFHSSVFGDGDVRFNNASFGDGNVTFDGSTFRSGSLSFDGARFGNGILSFSDVLFDKTSVTFVGSYLAKRALSFNNTKFQSVPDFRSVEFPDNIDVAGMSTGLPEMRWDGLFKVAKNRDDAAKFRRLKAIAIDAHDHEREGRFFASELMAKRGWETVGRPSLLLDTCYAFLCFYGQSILRPFIGIGVSFVTFLITYSLFILTNVMPLEKSLRFAAEYSAHNTTPLTNGLFRFALAPEKYRTGFEVRMEEIANEAGGWMDWIIGLSFLQQIIGAILLFLLLLGFRNRFRLK